MIKIFIEKNNRIIERGIKFLCSFLKLNKGDFVIVFLDKKPFEKIEDLKSIINKYCNDGDIILFQSEFFEEYFNNNIYSKIELEENKGEIHIFSFKSFKFYDPRIDVWISRDERFEIDTYSSFLDAVVLYRDLNKNRRK